MRIVAVADTHTFQRSLGSIPDGDVFVHAGDLVRRGPATELVRVAAWIRGLPHAKKVVVAGNHDWCFIRERQVALDLLGPDVIYLEDQECMIDGLVFYGSPWQPAYNDWAFNLPRGAPLAEKWALIPHRTDVLITHGPPCGFGDRSTIESRAGCADLRDAVRRIRPILHLFGHIHHDGGFWRDGDTAFANVTTCECERSATVIDIDPKKKSVEAVVVPPTASFH